MDETSHQQSYPVKYPDYFVGIEAIPKLTRGFVNLTIWWLFFFLLLEHGK